MPCCRPSLSAAWIRNSEQYGSSDLRVSAPRRLVSKKPLFKWVKDQEKDEQTLADLRLGNGPPLVRGYEPGATTSSAAEVYDELTLVVAQSCQDGIEALLGERCVGEEIGCDYHLLREVRQNSILFQTGMTSTIDIIVQ